MDVTATDSVFTAVDSAIDNGSPFENEAQPSTSDDDPLREGVDICEGVDIFEDEPYVKNNLYTREVVNMYNLARIIRYLSTREQCVAFAEEHGLIQSTKECRVHRKPMRVDFTANNSVGSFVCNRGKCRYRSRISRASGTWFERSCLQLPHIFYIMYAFAHHWSYREVILEDILKDVQHTCLSTATITNWYNYCRETIVLYYLNHQNINGKIGGPGKVVQIEESKFGKRKYNKGNKIDGCWILGLSENGSEDLRLEICPDHQHSADVLLPLIRKHVEEGTTIHTDCWKAYDCLAEYNFGHKKVNNSNPENPSVAEDGTQPRSIKTQWRVVKRFFNTEKYNMENFGDFIVEYMWRRTIKKYRQDPFIELIKAVKYVYKP